MEAKVVWQKQLAFTGTADTGFRLPLDTSQRLGGNDEGFLPMELIAIGIAGCTAMDVISILQKKRQKVTEFEVLVHAERATEHPKVFTSAQIDYLITGQGIDEAAVVRAIELSSTRYCPAQAMFSKIIPMKLNYTIFESSADKMKTLTTTGTYSLPE